jgi:hypothetical protein
MGDYLNNMFGNVSCIGQNVGKNYRTSGDDNVITYLNRSKDDRTGTDLYIVADDSTFIFS